MARYSLAHVKIFVQNQRFFSENDEKGVFLRVSGAIFLVFRIGRLIERGQQPSFDGVLEESKQTSHLDPFLSIRDQTTKRFVVRALSQTGPAATVQCCAGNGSRAVRWPTREQRNS